MERAKHMLKWDEDTIQKTLQGLKKQQALSFKTEKDYKKESVYQQKLTQTTENNSNKNKLGDTECLKLKL